MREYAKDHWSVKVNIDGDPDYPVIFAPCLRRFLLWGSISISRSHASDLATWLVRQDLGKLSIRDGSGVDDAWFVKGMVEISKIPTMPKDSLKAISDALTSAIDMLVDEVSIRILRDNGRCHLPSPDEMI